MAIEVTDVFQDSDCPFIVVWTKEGAVERSWDVRGLDVAPGNEVRGNVEEPVFRPASAEESAAILEAVSKWRAGESKPPRAGN